MATVINGYTYWLTQHCFTILNLFFRKKLIDETDFLASSGEGDIFE